MRARRAWMKSRLMQAIPFVLATAIALSGTISAKTDARLAYPETRQVEQADDWHGTKVPDPYRWLESDPRVSQEVAQWIAAENKVTQGWLAQVPQREPIRKRLTTLWNYERFSAPQWGGGHWFFARNTGLQNQSELFMTDSLTATPVQVLDPNSWSTDGTIALAGYAASDDGRYLAYARSVAGSDWTEWRVRDLQAGKDLDDLIQWTKFTFASWTTDSKGFFYSRYDAPAKGEAFQAVNRNQKLFYHRLGTSQSQDVLVYARPDQPNWDFGGQVTEDGRYLVISVRKGTDPKNMLLYRDLNEPYGAPVELIGTFDNEYDFLGNDGTVFYFKTDLDAPKGRLIGIDVAQPETAKWRTIVPEAAEAMQGADMAGDTFLVSYLKDATSLVRQFKIDGTAVRDVALPGIGSAYGFGGKRTSKEVTYAYVSFNSPPTVYRYDLAGGNSSLWKQPKVAFNPDDFVVKQVFYESKDKTKVPMFLVHRRDLKLDGNRPTLLYGYGGFKISMTPSFSPARLAWLEMGGVFAMPNLRGGGEYGEAWHKAGTKAQKQNVFDDFIAAAEWLVKNGYTKPSRLAISGGSNGGLLVGACVTQRPDLFGATLPAVGVMDMLRFDQFTAGRYWVDDYGSASDPATFPALLAYSPYHNIKAGTKYPPTLVTTADTDDRVIPAHSFKFAAAMQKAQGGDAPILIRIETSAGHGGGKPTSKQIEEATDQYAFLVRTLGMEKEAKPPKAGRDGV
ncbi:MAG TPA: prolyl oligopeptidase family serine peptidase [Candidatus Polarisedimenticolia bacterium]|nr:prolyl oligopeptidase family serine peptidase [Candidatus Polarisedimenticolia bacterium]